MQSQCLSTGLEITSASCTAGVGGTTPVAGSCGVVVKRKSGSDAIIGVRLAISTYSKDFDTDIALGASSPTLTLPTSVSEGTLSGKKMSAVAYYKVSGVKSYCPQAAEYTIA